MFYYVIGDSRMKPPRSAEALMFSVVMTISCTGRARNNEKLIRAE